MSAPNLTDCSTVLHWLKMPDVHGRWTIFFDWMDATDHDAEAREAFRAHGAAINQTPLLTDLHKPVHAQKLIVMKPCAMRMTLYAWLTMNVRNAALCTFVETDEVTTALAKKEHPARELVLAALNVLMDQASLDDDIYIFILNFFDKYPKLAGEECTYMLETCYDMLIKTR